MAKNSFFRKSDSLQKLIDLHTHTTASDGSHTPSELVFLAKKANLAAVAITDHDTISGIDEAQKAGVKAGVEVVPGVEISVGENDNMHILGLLIDHKSPKLNQTLDGLKKARDERNRQMIKKLQDLGFSITYEEVREKTGAKNMGRLHIAKTMEEKGMVSDYTQAFRSYLSFGCKAYVPRKRLGEKEGIEVVLQSGGIPVLAHINYLNKPAHELEETLVRLKNLGLMGVEVYYSDYDTKTYQLANYLAEKLGLLKSGGTDFHGTNRQNVHLGKGKGDMVIAYELLERLKNAQFKTNKKM
ncbi:MAG: PHP domain-containing protein [Eubacteriales bacterium]|nr:PHP domain-containing protein [Eubacteriales bacterium]